MTQQLKESELPTMVMNAKDALGYMEDVAIIHAGHREAEASRSRSVTMENNLGVVAAVALKERDRRLDALQQDRNNAVIHSNALKETLEHVVRDFARYAGVSEVELMKRYNIILTQHYNAFVNDGMSKGWFDHDPRLSFSEKAKSWYVTGLDSDHGF